VARLGYDGLNADADLQRWRDGWLNPVTRELIDSTRLAVSSLALIKASDDGH
jgi:hypothetical protein